MYYSSLKFCSDLCAFFFSALQSYESFLRIRASMQKKEQNAASAQHFLMKCLQCNRRNRYPLPVTPDVHTNTQTHTNLQHRRKRPVSRPEGKLIITED